MGDKMEYTISLTEQQYSDLPLVFRMLGIDHRQEIVNRPSGIPMWQIIYGKSGKGHFRIEKAHYILQEGDIVLLPPHMGHQYESMYDEWIVHFLGFSGNSSKRIMSDLGLASPGVYHLMPGEKGRDNILSYINQFETVIRRGEPQTNRILSKKLYSMLLDLPIAGYAGRESLCEESDLLISEIIFFLEKNYSRDISLCQIGEEFHLTPEYLCTRFKKSTGETIWSQLKRIRIGKARMMLLERPEITLREAGELCGFRSPSYFGKVFREMTGMTPQAYKNSR